MRERNKIRLAIETEHLNSIKVTVSHNGSEALTLRLFERGVMVFVECISMTPDFERSLIADGPALTYDLADALRTRLPWTHAEPILRSLYSLLSRTSPNLPPYPMDVYA